MKKIFALVLTLITVFSLAGCSARGETAEPAPAPTPTAEPVIQLTKKEEAILLFNETVDIFNSTVDLINENLDKIDNERLEVFHETSAQLNRLSQQLNDDRQYTEEEYDRFITQFTQVKYRAGKSKAELNAFINGPGRYGGVWQLSGGNTADTQWSEEQLQEILAGFGGSYGFEISDGAAVKMISGRGEAAGSYEIYDDGSIVLNFNIDSQTLTLAGMLQKADGTDTLIVGRGEGENVDIMYFDRKNVG